VAKGASTQSKCQNRCQRTRPASPQQDTPKPVPSSSLQPANAYSFSPFMTFDSLAVGVLIGIFDPLAAAER